MTVACFDPVIRLHTTEVANGRSILRPFSSMQARPGSEIRDSCSGKMATAVESEPRLFQKLVEFLVSIEAGTPNDRGGFRNRANECRHFMLGTAQSDAKIEGPTRQAQLQGL